MEEKIEALLICPMKKPERIFITDSLEDLQKAVGGYIEQFSNFDDDAVIVCNEEGKLRGLPLLFGRQVAGKLCCNDLASSAFLLLRRKNAHLGETPKTPVSILTPHLTPSTLPFNSPYVS